MKTFDLIVIGAGAGLGKVARPVASLGKKVAVIEKWKLGGTCLNRGCIPSKMLIHPADVILTVNEAHKINVSASCSEHDFKGLIDYVSYEIDEECAAIHPEKHPNISLYKGEATFLDNMTLEITMNDSKVKEVVYGNKIVLAVGTRPEIPDISGLKDTPYWTSTEALRPSHLPKSMAVIGGGYIATELSHFYASFGSKVSLFVRSKLLRNEDSEIAEEFKRVFSKRPNLTVLENCIPSKVEYSEKDKKFLLTYQNKEKNQEEIKEFEQLLVAVGVKPNTDNLNLDKTGVKLKKRGFVEVDDYLKTSNPNIYAFGDCIGKYLLRHSANYEGEWMMENLFSGKENPEPIDYTALPHAIFSNPQVAGVGCTEDEIKEKGIDYVKGIVRYKNSAMGMALRSDSGMLKLLIEKKTRKILGFHVVGEEASVLIHEVLPIMRNKGKLDDILNIIHIHPSLSELVRNSARKAKESLIQAGVELPLHLKYK